MRKIFYVEMVYYKKFLLVLYFFVSIFLIINVFMRGFSVHLIRIMIVSLPIIGIVTNAEEKKSPRHHLYVRLPLSLFQIGVVRNALWVTMWLSLVVLFGISELTHHDYHRLPSMIFTLSGGMIIIGSMASIAVDLRYMSKSRHIQRLMLIMQPIIMILLGVLYLSTFFSGAIAKIMHQPMFFSLIIFMIAIGAYILSIVSFMLRRSYLE